MPGAGMLSPNVADMELSAFSAAYLELSVPADGLNSRKAALAVRNSKSAAVGEANPYLGSRRT